MFIYINLKLHVACNFDFVIETEGKGHMQSCTLKMVISRKLQAIGVVTTGH